MYLRPLDPMADGPDLHVIFGDAECCLWLPDPAFPDLETTIANLKSEVGAVTEEHRQAMVKAEAEMADLKHDTDRVTKLCAEIRMHLATQETLLPDILRETFPSSPPQLVDKALTAAKKAQSNAARLTHHKPKVLMWMQHYLEKRSPSRAPPAGPGSL